MKKKLIILTLLVLASICVGCTASNEASASQQTYPSNLKCIGATLSTRGNVVMTFRDEEHNKIIYTIEDQFGHAVSITSTDLK